MLKIVKTSLKKKKFRSCKVIIIPQLLPHTYMYNYVDYYLTYLNKCQSNIVQNNLIPAKCE